jgi:hypothetical protein
MRQVSQGRLKPTQVAGGQAKNCIIYFVEDTRPIPLVRVKSLVEVMKVT